MVLVDLLIRNSVAVPALDTETAARWEELELISEIIGNYRTLGLVSKVL